jgi:hypothetical protein
MDPFNDLVKLSRSGISKVSVEATTLIEQIARDQPELAGAAQKVMDNWPEPTDVKTVFTPKSVGIGGLGIASVASIPWVQPILLWLTDTLKLPDVFSPIPLLIIVASIGAIAGAAYSIYCHRGVVFPTIAKMENVLTLTRLGILNEIGFGGAAAILTVWMSVVGLNVAVPLGNVPAKDQAEVVSTKPNEANPDANKKAADEKAPASSNLLTWSVVLGALVSGWLGARMRSTVLDRSLLKNALAETSIKPAGLPNLESMIRFASSASVAAHLATGKDVVGANQNILRTTQGTEANVNQSIKELLSETRVSGLVNFDGENLKTEMLIAANSINPTIVSVLGDLSLKEISQMSEAEFINKATELGLAGSNLSSALKIIRVNAIKVIDLLKQLPPNWTWPK